MVQAISTVLCCNASIEARPGHELVQRVKAAMDLSCQIPAEAEGLLPQLVIGTLDYNIGEMPCAPLSYLHALHPASRVSALQYCSFGNDCMQPAGRMVGLAAGLTLTWRPSSPGAGQVCKY